MTGSRRAGIARGTLVKVFTISPDRDNQVRKQTIGAVASDALGEASNAGGSCSRERSSRSRRNRMLDSLFAAYAYSTHTTFVWRNVHAAAPS